MPVMFYSDIITYQEIISGNNVHHLHNNVTKRVIKLRLNRCEHCFRP